MKILLKPTQILGRIVKVVATRSGLILPGSTSQKKESILFLIDEVGSAVNPMYKAGDIVCPVGVNNVILRGVEFHIIEEEMVFCGVSDLGRDEIEIVGEKNADTNGSPIAASAP